MSQEILESQVTTDLTAGNQHFPPFEVTDTLIQEADERIAHYPISKLSAVLPLIHIVQHKHGYVSAEAITWIAEKLEVEPIKVESVVTFYPGFRQSAPGKFHIRVCRTLSCAMAGSYDLMNTLCELANIDKSSTTHESPIAVSPCGNYSVEFAECLASCGSAPVCLINDDFHEHVTCESAEALLSKYTPTSKPSTNS